MGNHKNHGNRQAQVNGFRPGHVPAIVNQTKNVSYKMGINTDAGKVIIEWNLPITNLQMDPGGLDEFVSNLQGAKAALLAATEKKPT